MWVHPDLRASATRLSMDIISLARVIGSQIGIQPNKKKNNEILALHHFQGIEKKNFSLFSWTS